MLFCYQCQIFKTIIYSVGHETIYFEKYLRTAASENLSDAAILIFRRYFRSSSLSAFCKVSIIKTSVKFLEKHICWSFFWINLQTKSEILLDERLHHDILSLKHLFNSRSSRPVFLEISQNLQESTFATGPFLIKLQA